jgi:hypothetical protein
MKNGDSGRTRRTHSRIMPQPLCVAIARRDPGKSLTYITMILLETNICCSAVGHTLGHRRPSPQPYRRRAPSYTK